MNKLFTVLIAFLALLGGAFAEGYGQTAPYGQYGLYSNGGSWAFPSVNSSPFEQGAEYTIRNSYVVDAEFPEELLVGAGVGYGNPEAGFGNRYAYDDYAYGNYAYDDYAFPPYGGEAYGQPAYGQPVDGYGYGYAPDAMDSMDYYPRDRTIESLGNGYVSRAYNACSARRCTRRSAWCCTRRARVSPCRKAKPCSRTFSSRTRAWNPFTWTKSR